MSEHALEDTQELDLSELQDDPEAMKIASHLPPPSVVRAAVVGVVGLIGAVVGKEFNSAAWLDPLLDAYIVLSPLALGLWAHRKVKATVAVATVEEYVGKHRAT
ncbi:hypothetical protein JF714_14450 [Mycobacterium avium]|uniref:hypothetical protein n=1 Tax=Mycobacterium avium TaxID=1764 RepID=UPI001CDA874E|nr:hypothetical protein [Mycobacterium avium]MCA2331644.1 hypothetical protein [Mycobacterium avium]